MNLRNQQITLGELWDDPKSRAVFQRRVPMLTKHPVRGSARSVTLQQLADFLAVDRSAMSTALGKLRDEGVLTFQKNHFHLLQQMEQTD